MNKQSRIIVAAFLAGLFWAVQAAHASAGINSQDAPKAKEAVSQGISTQMLARIVAQEKRQSEDWNVRKEVLAEYGAFANAKTDRPLREFSGKDDRASRVIEQGKAALVFGLLRKLTGEEKFSATVRTLSDKRLFVTWDEIRSAFEKTTGADLGWFFMQWVDRKGLPDIQMENASLKRNGSRFEVSFDLAQKGEAYRLDLPVSVSLMRGGSTSETVKIDGEKKHVELLTDEEPAALTIDRDYEVPRRLSAEETPPLLASLLREEKPLIVAPVSNGEAYAAAVDFFTKRGGEKKDASAVKDADIRASALVLFGSDNPVAARLFGKAEIPSGGFSLVVKKNPWNDQKTVVIVQAPGEAEAGAILPKIGEYAQYSRLAIERGAIVSGKTDESQRGLVMELREQAGAIDVSTLKTLADVIRVAADKKIVYIGEYHDRFAHHQVQLQVIRELSLKNAKLAIGMEMFQRPFQKVVDDFISGSIDERQFLKKTEYFKRWGFDYNLYKPILDFTRAQKIPVVALNIRKEITDKVSKSGIDSLTEEEKKDVPPSLDFSDDDYRDRLKDIFNQHRAPGERSFDFFYQAQVLWDETMAMSIDEYLKKNPDAAMVVVVGGGHLAYGSGIPKRAFRRNGLSYFIALNDGDVDREIANYIILPQPLEGITAPKLMAMLKVDNNRVSVVDLPEDSVSRKAGIKTDDTILALDGQKVESVEDIKLILFYKKRGETVNVNVLRKRFLLGEKEMTIAVKL